MELDEGGTRVRVHFLATNRESLITKCSLTLFHGSPADELASLRETAYLLQSPANAARLLSALTRARKAATKSQDLAELRAQVGLEK